MHVPLFLSETSQNIICLNNWNTTYNLHFRCYHRTGFMKHMLSRQGIAWAQYQLESTCSTTVHRMSRGLKTPLSRFLLSKGLNRSTNGLNKSSSWNARLAPFSSISRLKLTSQDQELRQFSSLCVAPDRPPVDEHFDLEVCILLFLY